MLSFDKYKGPKLLGGIFEPTQNTVAEPKSSPRGSKYEQLTHEDVKGGFNIYYLYITII